MKTLRNVAVAALALAAASLPFPARAAAPEAKPAAKGAPDRPEAKPAAKAAPTVPDAVRRAVAEAPVLGQDGRVLRQATEVVLGQDGRVVRRELLDLQPFTPWLDAHGYFDPSVDWNDARSTLTIDEAWTFTPEGRLVAAKENSLVANTAAPLEWAAPYASLREMTVSQVGVETRGVTRLAYTIADRAPAPRPAASGVLDLDGPLPIAERSIELAAPAASPIRWSALGCALAPRETRDGGLVRLALRRADAPAVVPNEALAGNLGRCRLAYSTAADWNAVRADLFDRIDGAAKPTAAIEAAAKRIVGDATLDVERIEKLHAFVVDGVRTVRWPIAAFDFEARPAAATLDSSVGHPLDKAVLLAALLRADGRRALIVLAADEPLPADVAAAPQLLTEAWVAVDLGGRTTWFDPTTPLAKRNVLQLAGRSFLTLDAKAHGLETLPALDAARNRAALDVSLKLEERARELAVAGAADLDVAGLYDPAPAFDRDGVDGARVLGGALDGLGRPGVRGTAVAAKSAEALSLRLALEGGAVPLARDDRPVALRLPRVPGALRGDALQIWRGRRARPLRLPVPAEERTRVALELPAGFEPLRLPAPLRIDNAVGSYAREVSRNGRSVVATTTLVFKKAVVPPSDYPALRELLAAAEGEDGATIVLVRKER